MASIYGVAPLAGEAPIFEARVYYFGGRGGVVVDRYDGVSLTLASRTLVLIASVVLAFLALVSQSLALTGLALLAVLLGLMVARGALGIV